jgi:hypothetical protein
MKATRPYSISGRGRMRFVARWSKTACCVGSVLLLALLLAPPVFAAEPSAAVPPPASAPAADQNAALARVSFVSGADMMKGNGDKDWSYATLNTVVEPGDSLWADKEGIMEVEVVNGSYMRMVDGSKAEIVSLSPSVTLRASTGSFYVQRLTRSSGDLIVETPVGKVRIDLNSDVRIDILTGGETTVTTRWGRAIIQAEGGSGVAVPEGQRSYIDPGYLPSTPVAFDRSAEDSFDNWNRDRVYVVAVGEDKLPASANITPDTIGAADLAAYGDWVNVDGTEYWHPTVNGYVPYREGDWDYIPAYGYIWDGAYPFSYVTCHYGRWNYFNDFGWCWSYEPGWSNAWVAGIQCGPSFAWCPLDPFGFPVSCWGDFCFIGGNRFFFGACSFCDIDDLLGGHCRVHNFDRDRFERAHGDFHAWNFDRRHEQFAHFRDASFTGREFWPHQGFRGRDTLAGFRDPASTRVARLESGVSAGRHTGLQAANIRTPMDRHTDVGVVRNAQVGSSAISRTRLTLGREMRPVTNLRTAAGTPRSVERSMGGTRNAVAPNSRRVMTGPTLNGRGSSTAPRGAAPMGRTGRINVSSAPVRHSEVMPGPRITPNMNRTNVLPAPSRSAPLSWSYSAPRDRSSTFAGPSPRAYSGPSVSPRTFSGPSMSPRTFSRPSVSGPRASFSAPRMGGGGGRMMMSGGRSFSGGGAHFGGGFGGGGHFGGRR